MLAPHPGVRGAMPRHTPVLVEALRGQGCELALEPWGRRRDDESLWDKLVGGFVDIPRIRRLLREQRFDLMVVKTSHEWRSLIRNIPLLAATRRLVPTLVVQFHGGRSDLLLAPGQRAFKAASAAVFRLTDGVLVLSSEEAREYLQFWPRGCFRVVANPFVPPTGQDVGDLTNGSRPAPPSLLFVGRVIKEKGIFELLEALAGILDRRDCRLLVAGDGPDAKQFSERVSQLALDQKVMLHGFLEGERLRDVYRSADVFVLPSYREGFPTAITEALSVGLPIVTTKTRGMADHLSDGENALLVAPRDPNGLAAALERILSDDELRTRMSAANRVKFEEFAPESVAADYLATLEEIVARRRSG